MNRFLRTAAMSAAAAAMLVAAAGPADAAHSKGKKYLDLELTGEKAEAAGDLVDNGGFGFIDDGTVGEGDFYLNHGKSRACVDLTFTGESDIAALHLHVKTPEGNPETGPVAIDFSSLIVADEETDVEVADGCLTGIDRDILRNVLTNPDQYYLNAHRGSDLAVVRAEIPRN